MQNFLYDMIITGIYAFNRIRVSQGQTAQRRGREYSAFAIKTHGCTIYRMRRAKYVSDPGHVIFLPRGASYSWECLEEGECLMIEFDCENCPDSILSSPVKSSMELAAIFSRLENLMLFRPHGYLPKCMTGLYETISRIAENEQTDYRFSSKKERIRPSVEYMEQHFSDGGIDIQTLARLSGISVVYFRKIFTEVYGMPPIRYLNMIKIEKAKGLLISDYSTIEDVAESVGYGNVYHFCKMFKQMTGISPGKYAAFRDMSGHC